MVKHGKNLKSDNSDNTFQAPAAETADSDHESSVASKGAEASDEDSDTDQDGSDKEFDPSEVTEEAEKGEFTYVEAPFNREVAKRWSNRLAMRQLRYGCLCWADVLGGLSRRSLSSSSVGRGSCPMATGPWIASRSQPRRRCLG